MLRLESVQHGARLILGSVVDHEQLGLTAEVEGQEALDDSFDTTLLVVRRNDNRDARVLGSWATACGGLVCLAHG